MSYYGSEKEFILSMFLKEYPTVLESLLGVRLSNIELEIPFGRKKMDLAAVDTKKRVDVYIENQLSLSDNGHLNQKVMPILQSLQEGIIVWIALGFQKDHLHAMKSYLRANPQKYINIYALELHPEALQQIEKLNSIYKLDVYWNLNSIEEINRPPLKVVWKHEQMPYSHLGRAFTGERQYDLERIEDVKEYVLYSLRNHIPNYLNLHKSKKHNQGDLTITLGGGKTGISYRFSVKNRRNLAFVEISFEDNQTSLFKKLVHLHHDMRKKIHPDITIKDRKFGMYFRPHPDISTTVGTIAGILRNMINYFYPYIYGRLEDSRKNKREVRIG